MLLHNLKDVMAPQFQIYTFLDVDIYVNVRKGKVQNNYIFHDRCTSKCVLVGILTSLSEADHLLPRPQDFMLLGQSAWGFPGRELHSF